MNVIVDEKENVTLTKEEKVLLALNEVTNMKLFKKAQFLFKKGLYEKQEVESFEEENYIEVSNKAIKGYSVLTNEEGELFLVKELKADSEAESYGYEVLSLPNVTEEEMSLLKEYKKPICIAKIALLCVYLLFLGLSLYGFLTSLFDGLGTGTLTDALGTSFLLYGTSSTIGLGILLLYFKGHKKCCKK